MGTVHNLEQLTGQLVSDMRRIEANWGSLVPSSSSSGTRDDPVVLNDDEDEVVVRVEREDTVVPPPWAGTPFVTRSGMVSGTWYFSNFFFKLYFVAFTCLPHPHILSPQFHSTKRITRVLFGPKM